MSSSSEDSDSESSSSSDEKEKKPSIKKTVVNKTSSPIKEKPK